MTTQPVRLAGINGTSMRILNTGKQGYLRKTSQPDSCNKLPSSPVDKVYAIQKADITPKFHAVSYSYMDRVTLT